MKTKNFDLCVLPIMRYGVETMALTKIKDRIKNTKIRKTTKTTDIIIRKSASLK